MPPVGKSGPLTYFRSVRLRAAGVSIRCSAASHSSAALCGGIEVAMPTAMPCEPLASRFGNARRQHHRLLVRAVVARPEIDRVLVEAVEQEPRDFRQPRFGVAHGGGVIAVDIAEIALAVDQRIALREILRQAHHRVVDRLVAVRMEITHHVADHLGRFLERRAGVEPQLPHHVQDAPVHRLEAVARVGQRAVHDGRQRVGEVALLERLAQRDVLDLALLGGNHFSSHGGVLIRAAGMNKR